MDDFFDGLDVPIPARESQLAREPAVSTAPMVALLCLSTYILKLPPTKNLRPMLAVVNEYLVWTVVMSQQVNALDI